MDAAEEMDRRLKNLNDSITLLSHSVEALKGYTTQLSGRIDHLEGTLVQHGLMVPTKYNRSDTSGGSS